jgi:hypothetical protein
MRKKLFISANVFFGFGFIFFLASASFANERYAAGASGGAVGMAIIAATFIGCGAFFLYKYLTSNPDK